MEEISWTDHVRNGEVLYRVKGERGILRRVNRRKGEWIGHILHRNCLLKHCFDGKVKGIGEKEDDVSSLWSTFKKTGGTEICRKKH